MWNPALTLTVIAIFNIISPVSFFDRVLIIYKISDKCVPPQFVVQQSLVTVFLLLHEKRLHQKYMLSLNHVKFLVLVLNLSNNPYLRLQIYHRDYIAYILLYSA